MKNKFVKLLFMFIFSCLLFTSCSSRKSSGGDLEKIVETKRIIIGTEAGYPPFEYVDAKGNVCGYDIEIGKLIKEKIENTYDIKIKLEVQNMNFDSLIGALSTDQIDLVIAAMDVTPERKEECDFSSLYYSTKSVVIVRNNYDGITDYSSLKDKKIGVQQGTTQNRLALEATGFNNVRSLPTFTTLLSDIDAGNIDGILIESPVANTMINNYPGKYKIIDDIEFNEENTGYGIACKKGSNDLINLINIVIEENEENGKLDELYTTSCIDAEKVTKNEDKNLFVEYMGLYGKGLLITISFSLSTVIIGSILGFLLSLALLSKNKYIQMPAKGYVAIVRGTPMLVQLYLFAYGIPALFHLNLGIELSGIIALGLNSTAYVAEIFRSGIQSIDKGQKEAALSLGYSNKFITKKIIFPQALKNILPAIGNELVTVVKESSIISVIGIMDITKVTDIFKANTMKVFEGLIIAAILYFALTYPLSKLVGLLERKLNKNVRA